MDRGAALRKPDQPAVVDGAGSQRRWSNAPHHRRRRAIALVLLAVVAVVVVVVVGVELVAGGGGTAVPRAAQVPHVGFFGRIRALAGNGSESLAASELAAENAAINRTLAYTPWVRIAGSQHREVALTFDDGPGPYTPEIISVLEREDVPATFFEVGVMERYFYSSTAQIAALGDPIGDHTEIHAAMSKLSPAKQRAQLLEQASAIEAHGARFPRLFRPPYGLWDAATIRLLHRYGMLMVLWTVDTNDYRRPGVSAIVNAALKGAKPGAIILLHDAGGDRSETVAALPKIIAALRRRHYQLVTIPRLLLDNPAPRNQDIAAVIGTGG
jgi:peptidoglycan/xylan/chitin deacetylase (PgdA/CDA1 family)